MLAQFPDARLVVTRRDGEEVLRSTLSMVASQMAFQTDSADIDTLEAEWRRKLALRDRRMVKALADFDGPVAHVDFDELGRDWRGAMRRLHAELSLDLPTASLEAMSAEHEKSASDPHHAHRSQIEGFA